MHQFTGYEVSGSPPPWSVTGVDKFMVSVIERAEREGGDLPESFFVSLCPWGERNAVGRGAVELRDVMDPRFRLVHFTGCGRPYLVVVLTGDDAAKRQQIAMKYLPWSEHYRARLRGGVIELVFVAEVEEPEIDSSDQWGERRLVQLFQSGELSAF